MFIVIISLFGLVNFSQASDLHIDVVGENVVVEIDGRTTIVPFDKKLLTDGNSDAIVKEVCKKIKCKETK